MSEVTNFKCPGCGAKLTFNGEKGEMACDHCGASFTMEQVKAAEEAEKENGAGSSLSWEHVSQGTLTDENGKISGYVCPSCNAEMVATDLTAATECPYCGNPSIVAQSFEGVYKPDVVVPFAVNKETAKSKLKEFIKGKKLLPANFANGNRIDNITGLYVPFWLFSCHADGFVTFDCFKEKKWSDAKADYVKKDYYSVKRSGEMDFNRIPVDAATQMDDATMDSLEPYDMSKAVPYDAAYFSGYLADKYDVTSKDSEPRANDRVRSTFVNKMQEAVKGYDSVLKKNESINLTGGKSEYAMLPVWMMSGKFEGKTYHFAVNGQTGRMVGELPVDKSRYWGQIIKGTGVSMIILAIILFFMDCMDGTGFMIALVISLIIAFIRGAILKGSMKNISKRTQANEYMVKESLKMRAPLDRFLYTKTDRKEKTQN